jgi:hypothetical protein
MIMSKRLAAKVSLLALIPLAFGAAHAAEPAKAGAVPAPTLDTNGDGKPDAWDRDGNGAPDAWDTNADGQPDAFDKDGDGKPDPSSAPAPQQR